MSSFVKQRGTKKTSPWTAYWHADDPASGKRIQHSKGGFRIKADAQAHLNKVMGEVQNDTFTKDTKITVAQLLNDHWLPTKRTEDLRASTLQQYADIIDHWILHEEIGLGGIKAQALTPLQVTKWREALKNTKTSCGRAGLSPRSISASVGVLKAAYKWAALSRLIPRDPIAAVSRGKMNMAVKPEKAWTGAEAKKFLAFTASDRLHAVWQLALVGGLRRGELCGLRWEDIDFEKGTVRIARTRVTVNGHPQDSEPKTKGSRRVLNLSPVMPHLKALEKIQKEDRLKAGGAYSEEGYLVADALGQPCHPETLSGWFEGAVTACGGLRRISLHGCRHTCATNMLTACEPIDVVSMFLGHSNVQITLDVYGHVLPGQQEQAVTALVAEYS